MTHKPPIGKGAFIWAIRDCRGIDGSRGFHARIAERLKVGGFSHAFVKITNGLNAPGVNFQTLTDTRSFCNTLRNYGIAPYGWGYITGESPASEAALAAKMVKDWDLPGFVADMEGEFDTNNVSANASKGIAFSQALRTQLPGYWLGLSSYRFPSYHPHFPWKQILPFYDAHLPQIYEWGSHLGVLGNLTQSYNELNALRKLPFNPIVSAYAYGKFTPTLSELSQFFNYSKERYPSASFWELGRVDLYWPQFYFPIADVNWPIVVPGVEPPLPPLPPPPPPPPVIDLGVSAPMKVITLKAAYRYIADPTWFNGAKIMTGVGMDTWTIAPIPNKPPNVLGLFVRVVVAGKTRGDYVMIGTAKDEIGLLQQWKVGVRVLVASADLSILTENNGIVPLDDGKFTVTYSAPNSQVKLIMDVQGFLVAA